MRDVLQKFQQIFASGKPLALIRVVETWGSSPRPVGAMMLVTEDLQVEGSVSAGCVENEIAHATRELLRSGECRLLEFGISDQTAWSVGLSCGGQLKVLAEALLPEQFADHEPELWQRFFELTQQNHPCLLTTIMANNHTRHLLYTESGVWLGDIGLLSNTLAKAAIQHFQDKKSGTVHLEGQFIFNHYFPRQPQLLIIGATHIAIHLIPLAKQLEFSTLVIDPRAVFAREERFPTPPDHLVLDWPANALTSIPLNDDTYAVVLTHDPKVDDQALQILLKSPVHYIGVLGSRRTHTRRLERLKKMGFNDETLGRIHGPVGLPLGGKSPQEIALSIMAEIIQIKNKTIQ